MAGAGYADILEYLVVNLSEQIHIEIIRMEDVGVLAEANRLENCGPHSYRERLQAAPSHPSDRACRNPQ